MSNSAGTDLPLRDMANAIRALSMDGVQKANSGHPGMPMGMADVATVLFSKFMKFDAAHPDWADRDRFVLSAGHGSMLVYSLGYLVGYPGMTVEELKNFRQLGSKTAGHPEYGHAPGVETTTGPLGQGITTAVGMALAERMANARHGDGIVDHYTYVIAGDGCLMEGVSHEAISMAGHWKLGKLIVLWDDNDISIDGKVSLSCSDDQLARFQACGWDVAAVDGHDMDAVEKALAAARASDKPSLIACKTVIGYGAPNKQGTSATHGAPLGDDEIAATREKLGWPHAPFEVPEDVLNAWRAVGARGAEEHKAWKGRFDALDTAKKAEWERALSGHLPANFDQVVAEGVAKLVADKPKWATRKASQEALEVLCPAVPEMIGGSADLTGSNNTRTKAMTTAISRDDFSGRYIYYGIREFGMSAVMNGIALHGGFIPYGGTFLVFADYSRPAIRLSALMGIRVIYVMTHDSIGLGEDGPTHQPVEHVASLRAMPNVFVFRPCDAVETLECWAAALKLEKAPSVLALTRQGLPALRTETHGENLCAKGAYVLADTDGPRDVTLLATGSEVMLAMEARETLAGKGIKAAVVSMPCWELFDQQPQTYRDQVLGSAPRVAIEALNGFGWSRYTGSEDNFIGMKSFGASAPADELYKHFGITTEALVAKAEALVKAG